MTADDFRAQPHDDFAEQIVLGSMIQSPAACSTALSLLVATDFYNPAHVTIFETLAAMHDAREPTELGALHSRMLGNGTLAKVGHAPFLLQLVQAAVTPGAVAHYGNQLAEMANRRALIVAGTRITDRAYGADGATADELNTWATDQLNVATTGTGAAFDEDGMTADDLSKEPPGHRWVIPGLLERADRLVLTGAEGWGKSTLIRQLAVCAAAGLHPFDHTPVDAVKVLVVDAENGRHLSMRRYKPLLDAAKAEGCSFDGTLALHLEPGGLDLTQRGGSAWLMRRIEKFRPDLIVIGPLYRLHFGDPNDERDARRVAASLDRAREAHGAALILEAHSPHQGPSRHRTLRPVGSSLWMRWPEFGYGIRRKDDEEAYHLRVSTLAEWRGPRDERKWPKQIRSGAHAPGGWPWVRDEEIQGAWA